MKTLIILAIICLSFSAQCFAQYKEEHGLYVQKVEKYRRMKSAGQTLTFVGSGMTIIGFIMLSNVTTTTNSYGQTTTTGNVGGGIALYLLGTAAAATGVPLWIVGGINKGRYERKLQNVSVKLSLTRTRDGVGLRYKF